MAGYPRRIAMVSMHTSPAAQAGSGDAGGMNITLRALASELAARGIEIELLTRAHGRPTVTELESGVVLHELAAGPPGPLDKNALAAVSDEFGEAVATMAGRSSRRYDLIHAHYWLSGIATLPVALELALPLVQSFHTLAAMKDRAAAGDQPLEPARRRHAESFLAAQATAIVAGSAAEATCLIDEVRAPADRVWVIPPGVDVDHFRPNRMGADSHVRSVLGIAPGRPILAVAGRIQPLKGQDLAIRALAELREVHGWAPVLVIAGSATPGDESYERSLHDLAARLEVRDSVLFVGPLERERMADLFAAATITLVPSHSETFGLVALESAASGTPAIGYGGTGLAESIADGRSGILVDSREPGAWAVAIARLLEGPVTLSRLSASAREHALGYTWAATATALLGVYSSLL